MLAEVEEIIEEQEEKEMPSFNHSYICKEVLRQLFENDKIDALPELTLDIEKGITPDISIYPREIVKPNFLQDVVRFPVMPVLAIEVISASQNIQDLLEKARILTAFGTKAVWTIEPFGRTIFVTTKDGEKIFHNQEIESEGIKVDFRKIFNVDSE
jgi:Uma2 family endonuclease